MFHQHLHCEEMYPVQVINDCCLLLPPLNTFLHSGQISLTSSGSASEVPPPAPPRSFSVRQSANRKSGSSFGSRDASPTSTPQVCQQSTVSCVFVTFPDHFYSDTLSSDPSQRTSTATHYYILSRFCCKSF